MHKNGSVVYKFLNTYSNGKLSPIPRVSNTHGARLRSQRGVIINDIMRSTNRKL